MQTNIICGSEGGSLQYEFDSRDKTQIQVPLLPGSHYTIISFHAGHCGVCVVDGWFEQPHLTRITLIVLRGWVRLPTCCALTDLCARVKPAIKTHALSWHMATLQLYITVF